MTSFPPAHFKMNNTLRNRIRSRLENVYGTEIAPRLLADIDRLTVRYAGRITPRAPGWSERDALLITYADSILEAEKPPLQALRGFLKKMVGGDITYLHLLPFYPYSSDDGFAVEDYRAVRRELGRWDDIRELATDYRLVFDGVINHVSASSVYMKGYCSGDPAFRDYFLALDPATDTSGVLRTRDLPLLHSYNTHAGVKWLWTTFSRDQVDLNFANPEVLLEVLDVLLGYAANGASMIRLDAIPYLWKQLGTTCAHLPRTHEIIKLMRDVLDVVAPHVLLLTETNVPHRENVAYFGDRGDEAQMIYNFSLAPLILWSLVKGDAAVLADWARGLEETGPRATYLNITATHDGIGMRPTEGILSEAQRAELVRLARDHGGDVTGKRNADGSIAPYELNLSYFDAVNDPRASESDDAQVLRFIMSQAIPMSLLGMPGIYIHSLLGSRNDYEGARRTGRARGINRETLRMSELAAELAKPGSRRGRVFAEIKRMLAIRGRQSAFHPDAEQRIPDLGAGVFAVWRRNRETGQTLLALHNVTGQGRLVKADCEGVDVLAGCRVAGKEHALAPYQSRWIVLNAGIESA